MLKGSGFVENMRITVKSAPVSEMKLLSPDQVSVRLPALSVVANERVALEVQRGDDHKTFITVELVPTVKAQSVTPLQARTGERITVTGQHLNLIRSVQFGDRVAQYRASTDGRWLEVTVPPGAPSGAISATDVNGFIYTLTGSFSVQTELVEPIQIEAVDYGQSHLRPSAESFDLTPGKRVIVRAKVSAATPGNAGSVKLKVNYAQDESQTYNMNGPAHIPLKSAIRADDLSTFYTYVLSGDQVKPGMKLTVEAAASDKTVQSTVLPRVVAPTRIHVELKPLIFLGTDKIGNPSKLTNDGALKRQLKAMFPISEIVIKEGASLPVSNAPEHTTEKALQDLIFVERLKRLPPNHYVMGILPGRGEAVEIEIDGMRDKGMMQGLAGIGDSISVVWDGADDMVTNAAHELAHNLGRPHPNDDVRFPDESFPHIPHREGIGAYWGINLTGEPFQLYDPKHHYDLMSYLGTKKWISTYNFDRLGEYASRNLAASSTMLAYAPDRQASRTPVISMVGTILSDRVSFSYSHRERGQINMAPIPAANEASSSEYTMEITFANGAIATYPLKLRQLSGRRAEPTSIFDLSIADSGSPAKVRVRHGTTVIFEENQAELVKRQAR
ncbi:hypothetical protein WM23_22380 [Burkholderia ubonensis]|nr:hypothetical protein WM23_22380 [Burkholderia ubonensis]